MTPTKVCKKKANKTSTQTCWCARKFFTVQIFKVHTDHRKENFIQISDQISCGAKKPKTKHVNNFLSTELSKSQTYFTLTLRCKVNIKQMCYRINSVKWKQMKFLFLIKSTASVLCLGFDFSLRNLKYRLQKKILLLNNKNINLC